MNKDVSLLSFSFVFLSLERGSHLLNDDKEKNTTERFITYKPRECTWDSKLILTKSPWPVRSASYTVSLTLSYNCWEILQHGFQNCLVQSFQFVVVYIVKDISIFKKLCRPRLFLDMQIMNYLIFWISFSHYKDSWYGGLRPKCCKEFFPNFLPPHWEPMSSLVNCTQVRSPDKTL